MKDKIIKPTRNELLAKYHFELGKEYDPLMAFAKRVMGIGSDLKDGNDILTARFHFSEVLLKYLKLAESDGITEEAINESCDALLEMWYPGFKEQGYTEGQKLSLLKEAINQYLIYARPEEVTKPQRGVLKGSLQFDVIRRKDGTLVFDSSKATRITARSLRGQYDEKTGRLVSLRIVSTGDSGFARDAEQFLKDAGVDLLKVVPFQINVDFRPDPKKNKDENEKELAELNAKRWELYRNGITDIANGKHYMFVLRGPSMARRAMVLLLPGITSWSGVLDLWYKVLRVNNAAEFRSIFGEMVNMSKMLARVSLRGSSTLDLTKLDAEMYSEIQKWNLLYVKDKKFFIDKPYRCAQKNKANGRYEIVDGTGTRKEVAADGCMWITIEAAAQSAKAGNRITPLEYLELKQLWSANVEKFNTTWNADTMLADNNWETPLAMASRNPKLLRLLKKVIGCQFRGILEKGMAWGVDFNHITYCAYEKAGLTKVTYGEICTEIPANHTAEERVDLSEYDAIVSESVRKGKDCAWGEGVFEILAYHESTGEFCNLNNQFVGAMSWKNMREFPEIVKGIVANIDKASYDLVEAIKFHKAFGGADDAMDDSTQMSYLPQIMRRTPFLLKEPEVTSWRFKQAESAIRKLLKGKYPVPGAYCHMVYDPYDYLNRLVDAGLSSLPSGTGYFNGKSNCKAACFRSPMSNSSNIQRCNLVDAPYLAAYHDCMVFNGNDAMWDMMAGADFDGDECAVILDDNEIGAIVHRGIQDGIVDVWEEGVSGELVKFDPEDPESIELLIKFLVDNCDRDNTGKLANQAAVDIDLRTHIDGILFTANECGCSKVEFRHPKYFGADTHYGAEFRPEVKGDTLVVRGIVENTWKNDSTVWLDSEPGALVGTFALDAPEVTHCRQYWEDMSAVFTQHMNREIDKPKTGKGASDDLPMTKLIPNWLLNVQVLKGRVVGEKAINKRMYNSYVSLSVLGRIYRYIKDEVLDNPTSFLNKMDPKQNRNDRDVVVMDKLLLSLLTDEERANIYRQETWHKADGSTTKASLVDVCLSNKEWYASKVKEFMKIRDGLKANGISSDTDSEDIDARQEATGSYTMAELKREVREALENAYTSHGYTVEEMAAATYIANYMKDRGVNDHNSYAWLFFEELISIFERKNDTWNLVRVNGMTGEVTVKSGILFVDGVAVKRLENYEDNDGAMTTLYNGKRFAYLKHKAVTNIVATKTIADLGDVITEGMVVDGVDLVGFKHHGHSLQSVCDALHVTQGEFTVHLEQDGADIGRVYARIGDNTLGVLKAPGNVAGLVGLNGHTVHVTALKSKTAGAINKMSLTVVK